MTTAVRARQTSPHSMLPYVVLAGIVLAIVWVLVASGLWTDILRYRKDIIYLTKQHLVLVAVSGSAAIVTGVALGVWLSRPAMARYAEATIQAVNMATSIPTLGKLALMMTLLGIGPLPAIVGLWIATLLPIVRNTYEGLRAVPGHLIDAAQGMGMSPRAILRRVGLPNALFVIFAGIRTAMAVNVGTAPIAFLIGGGDFGGADLHRHRPAGIRHDAGRRDPDGAARGSRGFPVRTGAVLAGTARRQSVAEYLRQTEESA